MRSKFGAKEDIKIDVTMFDGCIFVPKLDDECNENALTREELRPHISLLVDISKGEDFDMLEFVCSAWPDCLEIQKVFIYRRGQLLLPRPWLGPSFKYEFFLFSDTLIAFPVDLFMISILLCIS